MCRTPVCSSKGAQGERAPRDRTRGILEHFSNRDSANPAGGYLGPSQESEITERFWGWSLGLRLPKMSLCAKVRA